MVWNPVLLDTILFGLGLELRVVGLIVGLLTAYVYKIYISSTLRAEQAPLRSTWFLWAILDVIAFVSRWNAGSFDVLLGVFTVGSSIIALLTITHGRKGWTVTESYCTVFVFGSIMAWELIGPSAATVCSLAGMTVATIPLIKAVMFEKAYESIPAWSLVLAATILNLADGQILTGVWFVILQLLILTPILINWKLVRENRRFVPVRR